MSDNRQTKNGSQLQKKAFFQKIGGTDQKEIFDEWTRQITYLGEDIDTDKLPELVHRTFLFGSDKTVLLLSAMMQHLYKYPNEETQVIPMYVSCIISSLKQDFSGFEVSPLSIIQLKIADYKENKAEYDGALNVIKKEYRAQEKEEIF